MRPAFIYDAVRTPFGSYGGALATTRPDDLAACVIAAIVGRSPQLDLASIDDVVWGNANGAGEENRNVGRMAGLLAGLPVTVPGTTVNRLCASSLDAAIMAARGIESGELDLVLTDRSGNSKLVEECTYPHIGRGFFDRLYTDRAMIDLGRDGAVVIETYGSTVDQLSELLPIRLMRAEERPTSVRTET